MNHFGPCWKNKRAKTRLQENHDRGAHLSTIISNSNHPKQLKAPKDSPPSAVFLHFTIQIPKTKQNFRFCGNKNKKLGNGGLKTNVPSQKKVLHGKVVDWKKWRHYHCPAGRAGLDSLASTASSTALKRSGFGDAGRSGAAWDTQAHSGAVRCT